MSSALKPYRCVTGFMGIEVRISQTVSTPWHLEPQTCKAVALMLTVNQQLVSKVYELSDEPELLRLKRWPLCVTLRQCQRALRALHSRYALSWLLKWQRWSICTLAIYVSKSICLLWLWESEAHSLLEQTGRRSNHHIVLFSRITWSFWSWGVNNKSFARF